MTHRQPVVPLVAVAALVAGLAACGDVDAELRSQVSDESVLQTCAQQLGLDPDDYQDFTDVDAVENHDGFIGEYEDFSDDHPDELGDLEDELADQFADQFAELPDRLNEEFGEDVFDDATDVESVRELIVDTDDYTDAFVDLEGCADLVRSQFGVSLLDARDEPDETGRPSTGTGSGTGTP